MEKMNETCSPTINVMFEDSSTPIDDLEVSHQLDHEVTMTPLHIDIKIWRNRKAIYKTERDTVSLHLEQSKKTSCINWALKQISNAFHPGIFQVIIL
jgi:hypothetical protein